MNVTNLMIEDHKMIGGLINKVVESKDKEDFKKMMWALEKHLFVEEKAVLMSYRPTDDEGKKMIAHVLEDHVKILDIVHNLEISFDSCEVDFNELEAFLKNHEILEETILYPRLDKEMPEDDRQVLIDRIKSVEL